MSAPVPPMQDAQILHLELSGRAQADASVAMRECLEQIPAALDLEPGTRVMIASDLRVDRSGGLLKRIASIGPRTHAHRAVRCTGLLARGYVRIGAGVDERGVDLAWGYAPTSFRPRAAP